MLGGRGGGGARPLRRGVFAPRSDVAQSVDDALRDAEAGPLDARAAYEQPVLGDRPLVPVAQVHESHAGERKPLPDAEPEDDQVE